MIVIFEESTFLNIGLSVMYFFPEILILKTVTPTPLKGWELSLCEIEDKLSIRVNNDNERK